MPSKLCDYKTFIFFWLGSGQSPWACIAPLVSIFEEEAEDDSSGSYFWRSRPRNAKAFPANNLSWKNNANSHFKNLNFISSLKSTKSCTYHIATQMAFKREKLISKLSLDFTISQVPLLLSHIYKYWEKHSIFIAGTRQEWQHSEWERNKKQNLRESPHIFNTLSA